MVTYRKTSIFIVALVCLLSGFISGVYVGKFKDMPFMKRIDGWSIGIYTGKDPFYVVSSDNISNPVLTTKDITDISTDFVADPFMVKEGSMCSLCGWFSHYFGLRTPILAPCKRGHGKVEYFHQVDKERCYPMLNFNA